MRPCVKYAKLIFIVMLIYDDCAYIRNSLQHLGIDFNTNTVSAVKCYTCEGPCYSENYCDCQTGMCEGQFCFSERRYDGSQIFLRKGCGKGKTKLDNGCEHQKTNKAYMCYCNENFCNQAMKIRSKPKFNISCNLCPKSNHRCAQWCQGDFCWVNRISGTPECGVGAPSLPFHYNSYSMWNVQDRFQLDRNFVCISFIASKSYQVKECICNGDSYCNSKLLPDKTSSVVTSAVDYENLILCYSCAGVIHDPALPPAACKQSICVGQFCVLMLHRISRGSGNFELQRHAGCLNTTRPHLTVLGCNQRWALDKWESLECVCKGDFCNQDVNTALAAHSSKQSAISMPLLFVIFIFISTVFSGKGCA